MPKELTWQMADYLQRQHFMIYAQANSDRILTACGIPLAPRPRHLKTQRNGDALPAGRATGRQGIRSPARWAAVAAGDEAPGRPPGGAPNIKLVYWVDYPRPAE